MKRIISSSSDESSVLEEALTFLSSCESSQNGKVESYTRQELLALDNAMRDILTSEEEMPSTSAKARMQLAARQRKERLICELEETLRLVENLQERSKKKTQAAVQMISPCTKVVQKNDSSSLSPQTGLGSDDESLISTILNVAIDSKTEFKSVQDEVIHHKTITPRKYAPGAETAREREALMNGCISRDEHGGILLNDWYISPPMKRGVDDDTESLLFAVENVIVRNGATNKVEVQFGPMHASFTLIEGSNTGAKSSVLEAILFVLGCPFAREIGKLQRGAQSELPQAAYVVSVHLTRYLTRTGAAMVSRSPLGTILIERYAYGDNTASYTLNGDEVSLKQLHQELGEMGLDISTKIFHIKQGGLQSLRIFPMQQQAEFMDLYEHLENVTGSEVYNEPLSFLSKRTVSVEEAITRTKQLIVQLSQSIQHYESNYGHLLTDMKEVEKRGKELRNLHLQKAIFDGEQELEELFKRHYELNSQSQTLRTALHAIRSDEHLQRACNNKDTLKQYRESLEQQLLKANKALEELQSSMATINAQRRVNMGMLQVKERELAGLEETLSCEKSRRESDEERLAVQNKLHSEQVELVQAREAEISAELLPLKKEREDLQAMLAGFNCVMEMAAFSLTQLKDEYKEFTCNKAGEIEKYEALQGKPAVTQQQIVHQEANASALQLELQHLQKAMGTKLQQLQRRQQHDLNYRKELDAVQLELENNKEYRNSKCREDVLKALKQCKREGKLPGLLGRMGDLCTIDSRYEKALFGTCSYRDKILVDTISTAEHCMELLSELKLEKGSFLSLEHMEHMRRHFTPHATPENVPRLFDLLQVEDERALPALYYDMRDTLVVTDMQQAKRIALAEEPYPVVTLNGEYFNLAKYPTNGDNPELNESNQHRNSLIELKNKAQSLRQKIEYHQKREATLELDLVKMGDKQTQLESDIVITNTNIQYLKEQLPLIFEEMEKQQQKIRNIMFDPLKADDLERRMIWHQEKVMTEEVKAEAVTNKINALDAQIKQVEARRFHMAQTKASQYTLQMARTKKRLHKANATISETEQKYADLKVVADRLRQQIRQAQCRVLEMAAKREEYERDIKEAREVLEVLEDNTIRSEANEAKHSQNAYEHKIKKSIYDLDAQMKVNDEEIATLSTQLASWREKMREHREEIAGATSPRLPIYTQEQLAKEQLAYVKQKECEANNQLEHARTRPLMINYQRECAQRREEQYVLDELYKQHSELRQLHDELSKRRYDDFMHGLSIVSVHLRRIAHLFICDCEVALVPDEQSPFTKGVAYNVRLPNQVWRDAALLLPRDRQLMMLALIFALHAYKPSSLYLLDEFDKLLDDLSALVVAHYIKTNMTNAQFAVIPCRPNLFQPWLNELSVIKLMQHSEDGNSTEDHPATNTTYPANAFIN